MKKFFTVLTVLLAGFATVSAQDAQSIPGTLDLSKGVYEGTGSYNADNEAMDGFKNGGSGTFVLSNTTAQEYTISFEATTKRDDVSLEFKIMNGETEVCVKEAKVANTGAWNAWQTFKCYLPELPVADNLTLVITMKSSGSNWTANVKNVAFSVKTAQDREDEQKENEPTEEEQVVNQIPTDDAHPFVLTGAKIEGSGTVKTDVENGAFDSFKNGATATVLIDCVEAGAYKIAFMAASKTAGATLKFSFFKEGETEAELEKEIHVQSETNWAWYEVKDDLGNLTVGKKTLVISFIAAEGESWTANMKDVKIAFNTDKVEIVNQIPTDADHPYVLTGAEITGSGEIKKDVENGAFDSFKNGATATVLVDCVTAGNYKVAFSAASKMGATLKFSFFKDGETEAELEKEVTVEAAGDWNAFDMEAELGQLSVGKKRLTITFIAVEGQTWTSNMKNVMFSLSDGTGIENVNCETITNNRYFDLQGRRLTQPVKGINIVNGKKVVK